MSLPPPSFLTEKCSSDWRLEEEPEEDLGQGGWQGLYSQGLGPGRALVEGCGGGEVGGVGARGPGHIIQPGGLSWPGGLYTRLSWPARLYTRLSWPARLYTRLCLQLTVGTYSSWSGAARRAEVRGVSYTSAATTSWHLLATAGSSWESC